MKIKIALAFLVLATAGIGTAAAEDRTAKLSDPATSAQDTGRVLREAPLQASPQSSATSYFSALEIDGIRAAVRSEIQALAARDAERAFQHLAPAAQDYYADAARFLAALKANLAPLLKAERFALAETERDSTDAVQVVVLTGTDGSRWLARFTVERQPDGGWGIKRCFVEAASTKPGV